MNTWLLALSMLMIIYGIVRFAIAQIRREVNSLIHFLWIPGAGFFYAFGILIYVWLIL
jgi:hypothetical protein